MAELSKVDYNFCEAHQAEIDFYCPECRALLCKFCVGHHLSDRKTHQLQPVQEALSDTQQLIEQNKWKVSQLQESVDRHTVSNREKIAEQEKELFISMKTLVALQSSTRETLESQEVESSTRVLHALEFCEGRRENLLNERFSERMKIAERRSKSRGTDSELVSKLRTLQILEIRVAELEGTRIEEDLNEWGLSRKQGFVQFSGESIRMEFIKNICKELDPSSIKDPVLSGKTARPLFPGVFPEHSFLKFQMHSILLIHHFTLYLLQFLVTKF